MIDETQFLENQRLRVKENFGNTYSGEGNKMYKTMISIFFYFFTSTFVAFISTFDIRIYCELCSIFDIRIYCELCSIFDIRIYCELCSIFLISKLLKKFIKVLPVQQLDLK